MPLAVRPLSRSALPPLQPPALSPPPLQRPPPQHWALLPPAGKARAPQLCSMVPLLPPPFTAQLSLPPPTLRVAEAPRSAAASRTAKRAARRAGVQPQPAVEPARPEQGLVRFGAGQPGQAGPASLTAAGAPAMQRSASALGLWVPPLPALASPASPVASPALPGPRFVTAAIPMSGAATPAANFSTSLRSMPHSNPHRHPHVTPTPRSHSRPNPAPLSPPTPTSPTPIATRTLVPTPTLTHPLPRGSAGASVEHRECPQRATDASRHPGVPDTLHMVRVPQPHHQGRLGSARAPAVEAVGSASAGDAAV